MEVKNVRTHAGWYKSYETSNQTIALIECLEKKIKQLEDLIETIQGETELVNEEYPGAILDSINALINQVETVSAEKDYFRWEM